MSQEPVGNQRLPHIKQEAPPAAPAAEQPKQVDKQQGALQPQENPDALQHEIEVVEAKLAQEADSQTVRKNYSQIPQLNTQEAAQIIQRFTDTGINPSIQLLAILSDTNRFTGQELSSPEDRIAYAIQFLQEKPDRFQPDSTIEFSQEGYASFLLREEIAPKIGIAQDVNVYREFLKVKFLITDKQVDLIMRYHNSTWDLDFLRAAEVNEERANFFKNPLFLEEPPPANRWTYEQYRTIQFPDDKGGMELYSVLGSTKNHVALQGRNLLTTLTVAKGYVDAYNKPTFKEKVKDVLEDADKVALQGQTAMIMLIQGGAIHPAKINGRWSWVLEPRARTHDDRRQTGEFYGSENKYYKLFQELKKQGVKVLTDENVSTPCVRIIGLEIQRLDHHRIDAAQLVGIPIVVEISREETFC